MAGLFKPEVTIITSETQRAYWNDYNPRPKSPYKTIQYPTYRELKQNIKRHLIENTEPTISVSRSRRGKWGEWFEKWKMVNGKPKIVDQGWM